MSSEVYQVLSSGLRYWFAALGLLIVLRSFLWLWKDHVDKHRRLRRLPDAGMIGEFVLLSGSGEYPPGTTLPVPREGTMGSVRGCDIPVPEAGLQRLHLDFRWEDRKGLLIIPCRGRYALVDGEEATRKAPGLMGHGSILQVGRACLRLRLFAGLETGYRVRFQEDVLDPATPLRYGAAPLMREEDAPSPEDDPGEEAQP
ncbi:MAG: FHA domain-containing protein [Clostridia bacterium]|nr:FHA domain-containing protein [Clostridia bacterium]